jgi:hypothetical protein
MKHLSILAVAFAATAAPAVADTNAQPDPFVSTQSVNPATALAIIGGVAVIVIAAAAASDGT